MNRRVLNAALVGVSLLFAFAVAELLLHLFPSLLPPQFDYLLYGRGVTHPVIGNAMKPNSSGLIRTRDFAVAYQVDEHGFRNDAPWPATADIVVIGDSLVFGYGAAADDAWPQVLARKTGRQVLNLGLIGASPQQYLRIYEAYGRALKPRLLVIGFFAANDFWDAEQFERWLESGVGGNYLDWRDLGQPSAAYAASVLGRLDMAVRKHVYLANMSAYAFKRMRAVAQENSAGVTTLTVGDELPLVLNEPYILKMTQRAKPGNSGFDAALDALVRIDRIARAEGTRLVVVFQPGKETVYLPMAGRAAPMPSRSLRDALDERDIATIYLAPVFQERARTGKALYYPTDGHPNALGYRLIAEQVAEWIERNVSFPGSS